MIKLVLLLALALTPFILNPAFAQTCVELGTCEMDGIQIWDFSMLAFTTLVGDVFYLMVWGVVILLVMIKTESTMLAGIIGLIIFAFLTADGFMTGFEESYVMIALVLLSVSGGFLLWSALRRPQEVGT